MSAPTLFAVTQARLAYGDLPLLDGASMSMVAGERVGLVGRNGAGKSTLLAVVAGRRALDDGEVRRRDALRVVMVEQEPALPPASTLRDALSARGGLAAIDDERERWRIEARLDEYLHRFGLPGAVDPAAASGGERKRAALALAFALDPELLVLDEPTNHLDIAGIETLDALMRRAPAVLFVTHDRALLDAVCTRIVELDRGVLRSFPGDFATYQRVRAEQLAAEQLAARRFDAFWAQEEAWIRKGVEARRTRNEGRVQRLEGLRRDRAARRERAGSVRLTVDAGERSGRRVAELEHVSKSFGQTVVVRDLSLSVQRGDRLALVGPNGVGKSTLLKIILGELAPDAGRVTLGTHLQVAYFDQLRAQLDPDRTVADTISPGSEWIEVGGQRRHVIAYLGDYLFAPRRASSPVRLLSGGERNRLLLARLFARPANLLVLDEPTNDLDVESLELLEAALQGFGGTLLLVSHDRAFLDNVVTQVLAAEGGGRWREYVGGYSDWVRQRPAAGPSATSPGPAADDRGRSTVTDTPPPVRPRKLGYAEQRELDALPGRVEALEREQAALQARMAEPDYFRRDARELRAEHARGEAIEAELLALLERWEALEQRARGAPP
jgi:ATP-binding cassette subfamily F protein uup